MCELIEQIILKNAEMPKIGKVQNTQGEIVEAEVLSEEESRILAEQYQHNNKITLQELMERGYVPLEVFDKQLKDGSNK